MPPGVALEVALRMLFEPGEHLLSAPGWVGLRFALWSPAKRAKHSSFETVLAGAAAWVMGWWGWRRG